MSSEYVVTVRFNTEVPLVDKELANTAFSAADEVVTYVVENLRKKLTRPVEFSYYLDLPIEDDK